MEVKPSDLLGLMEPDFAEEEKAYIHQHDKRFCYLLALIDDLVERVRRENGGPVSVLDVGPSFLTRCMRHFLGERITLNTLGWAHESVAPAKYIDRHWRFDLNSTQDVSRREDIDEHDIVVMAEVIEHLHTSPSLVLRFVRTLLKPGGLFVLQTPNAASIDKRLNLLSGRNPYELIRESTRNPGHFREYTDRELLHFTGRNGLRSVAVHKESYWPSVWYHSLLERIHPSFRKGLTLVCEAVERPDLGELRFQDSSQPVGLRADLDVQVGLRVPHGGVIRCSAHVMNTGAAIWLPSSVDIGCVRLGVRVFDESHVLVRDWLHLPLHPDPEHPIAPGESAEVAFDLNAEVPGLWTLEFDLVAEQVGWFEDHGSRPVRHVVEIY